MKTAIARKLSSALSLAALTTLLCANVGAQTTTWTNPSPGEWNLDSNWDFGIPGTGTNAVINAPSVVTYDLISIFPSFGSLSLGGALTVNTNTFVMDLAGTATAPVTVSAGGVLTVAPTGVLTASNCGPLTVSAGGIMDVNGSVLLRPETATTTNAPLSLSGILRVNSGGNFTVGVGGATTVIPGALVTNSGSMTFSNTGPITLNNVASPVSSLNFEAGSSFAMSATTGADSINVGSANNASQGGIMTLNGGSVTLDKLLTVRGTSSRAFVRGGTLNAAGGSRINDTSNDGATRIEVTTGGIANLGNFSVFRTTIAGGLIVTNGGFANATGIQIGTGNSSAYSTIGLGGTFTNTGAFVVQDTTNSANTGARTCQFLVRGGNVVSTDLNGIILANKSHTNPAIAFNGTVIGGFFDVNAGTVVAEKISLIKDTTITNAYARLNLSGSGTIYLGSGGLVGNIGAARTAFLVSLTGGTVGANADWASGAPMTLGNTVTFKASSEANVARNITLSNVLSGTSAVLSKTGGGTLTLLGTNTYTGNSTVSAGTLALGPNGIVASPIVTVASGATLAAGSSSAFSAGAAQISLSGGSTFDVSGAAGFNLGSGKSIIGTGNVIGSVTNLSASSLTPGNTIGVLTFGNGLTQIGGAANNFDLSAATNDTIEIVGDLTVSGANAVNITAVGGSLPAGTYTLFHYTGTFTGGVGAFTLGTPGYLTNIVAAKTISLVTPGIRAATNLTWVGGILNNWDIAGLTNWLAGASLDSFFQGDTVLFNASGAANPVVNVSANVNPASMTVDAAANYTLSGTGIIGGSGGLTKTNSGTLTLLTTNSYTGATLVGQGTLEVSSLANGGANSGIGAAPSAAANLVFEGTTLRYLGDTTSSDRGSTLNSSGVTLEVTTAATALTLNGATVGAGALTKTGPGTLILGVANGHTGGTVANNGTVQINNATSFGPAGYTNNGSTLKFGSGFTASQLVEFNGNCVIDLNAASADLALRGAWSGTGTVLITNLNNSARTFTIGGDGNGGGNMGAFSGTLNGGNSVCDLRFNDGGQQNYGSASAVFDLGTGGVRLVNRSGGFTIDLGALKGGPNTRLAGRASGSAGVLTYSIGALNTDTTFEGVITNFNSAAAITKVGTGKLTLTGASTYTGATAINAGTLQVDGSLGATTVTVTGGTLAGSGTIGGSVTVQTGATIAPGSSIGTLTVNSTVQLDSGSITDMEIDAANATNDLLAAATTITYGGTLNVTNLSGTLAAGQTYKLFSAQDEFSYFGTFDGGTNLPTLGGGLAWDTTGLATNGTISVYSVIMINPNPTNITFTASGGNLTLTWPADRTGWTLQTQTNTRSVGLKTNWFDVAGSSTTNEVTLPVDKANPTVFYRLFYIAP